MKNNKALSRIPVTLNEEDNTLVIQLRADLERSGARVTVAHIVRLALRELATKRGILPAHN